jgi:transposase-like protein
MPNTNSNSRRVHNSEFKARVALAALREDKTQGQLATQFQIHSIQINQWKKVAKTRLPELFERPSAKGAKTNDAIPESELFEQIGRLKMELEFLKKSS